MGYKKLFIACAVCLVNTLEVKGQEVVKVWEEPLTLPTYLTRAPDKNPMFFRGQSYQGASRYIYPYALSDNLTDKKTDKTYRAVYLENEYIKLCVLPEIGGRLFYATDKTNGYELFYRQHVIKPANIGMLGAWISGGVEFCVFHHHRASTNLPVDYRLEQNEDGSATIWIGETEPRHRMKWTLGITLYPGKSYLEVDGRLYNATENTNSILYWANVATHANPDYQVFFPPGTDFTVYHAKNSFAHWPVTSSTYNGKDHYKNNIDASWWKNHPDPVSMFAHDIKEGFLAGYDHGKKAGTMHVANHHIVKGAKLWEWGPGPYGSMWDSKVLTDSDGPYAELMAGAYSDNQPDYSWLKPYEYKTFKQYWYPLRETEGAVAASINAAINMKQVNEKEALIAVNTTQRYHDATISLYQGAQEVFNTVVSIAPEAPFRKIVTLPNANIESLSLLLKDQNGEDLLTYQPVKKESDLPLPEPVIPPKNPEEIISIEELYLTGLRIQQFHNARINAMPYFQEALKKDPLDSRSNTAMGIIKKQEFKLAEAAHNFRTALIRPTANYTRPRDCEAFYHLGVILKQQGQHEAAYDTLYRAAWDQNFASAAYYQLAQISMERRKMEMALSEINRSLDYNSSNLSAVNLKTAILRTLGKKDDAKKQMELALEKDALNFRALYEGQLLGVDQSITFEDALRGNPESYLELANEYLNAGLREEAKDILTIAINSKADSLKNYPTIHYYLGYTSILEGKDEQAVKYFKHAGTLPTDYCFPFRYESIAVYQMALKHNPADAKAYYYWGNILYDKQPKTAIGLWEKAVALDPGLAIAHRNLGWGHDQTYHDIEKAITAYEAAIKHNNTDPRYYYELDKLYEKNGTPVSKRYALLTTNHQYVSQRPDAFLQEIKVMLLHGENKKAIDYLTGNFFPRQEGVDNLHDIYVDACMAQGIAELDAGDYQAALAFFKMADLYPDNHQLARNTAYQRNAQIHYYQARATEKLNNKKEATGLLKQVTEMEVHAPRYQYYKALALQKTGKKANVLASEIEAEGKQLMSDSEDIDFFSKFGEGQSAQNRKAEGYYLLALAEILKNNNDQAKDYLQRANQLNPNDLWVILFLKNFDH